MTYPKMKPCPKCNSDDGIAVYTYESGRSRVECDKCHGIFSCENRKLDAIRAHNKAYPVSPANSPSSEPVENKGPSAS